MGCLQDVVDLLRIGYHTAIKKQEKIRATVIAAFNQITELRDTFLAWIQHLRTETLNDIEYKKTSAAKEDAAEKERLSSKKDIPKGVFGKAAPIAFISIDLLIRNLTRLEGVVDLTIGDKSVIKRNEGGKDEKQMKPVGGDIAPVDPQVTIQRIIKELRSLMGWAPLSESSLAARAADLVKLTAKAESLQPFTKEGQLVEANRDILMLKFMTKEAALYGCIPVNAQLKNYSISKGVERDMEFGATIVDRAQSITITAIPGGRGFRSEMCIEVPLKRGFVTIGRLVVVLNHEVDFATGNSQVQIRRQAPSFEANFEGAGRRELLEALNCALPDQMLPRPKVQVPVKK